jgi:hypothetical protein
MARSGLAIGALLLLTTVTVLNTNVLWDIVTSKRDGSLHGETPLSLLLEAQLLVNACSLAQRHLRM